MRCLCLASYPPSPPLTLYVVCCVGICFCKTVCMVGRGGILVCMRPLFAMNVCVMHPPIHCDNLYFHVLPILPLQGRTTCVLVYNHSRLEHLVYML